MGNGNTRDTRGRFLPGNAYGFRPGQSGNPSGSQGSIVTSLRKRLAVSGRKGSPAEEIAAKLIEKACEGDIQAIREILDRIEGKPRQAVDLALTDWRAVAEQEGLNEADVIREAKLLIESVDDRSDSTGD